MTRYEELTEKAYRIVDHTEPTVARTATWELSQDVVDELDSPDWTNLNADAPLQMFGRPVVIVDGVNVMRMIPDGIIASGDPDMTYHRGSP